MAEADAPVSVINLSIPFVWTEKKLADRTEFTVISYHDFHFWRWCTSLRQDLGFKRIRAGQTTCFASMPSTPMNMISEKSISAAAVAASGPTRVNQFPRKVPSRHYPPL